MSFGTGFFIPGTGGVSGPATSLASSVLAAGYDKVLYVSKLGNNTGATGAADKPFLTIQAALNYASSSYSNFNDSVIVVVGPGQYTEDLTVNRYNTYIVSQLTRTEQRAVTIVGTITINCATASSKYNQIVGLEGIFISSASTNPTVKITGTAEHLTYLKGCYIASSNTNVNSNCLFLDSTLTVAKSKVIIENCTLLSQKAGPDILKISGGDVNMDSNRILTPSISGGGNGITQNGDSVVLIDRMQIDITNNGKCLNVSSTYPTSAATASCYVSNSSLSVKGASSAEAIYTTNSVFLWNVLLGGKTTSSIVGSGAGSVYLSYSNVISALPSVSVTTSSLTPVKLSSI